MMIMDGIPLLSAVDTELIPLDLINPNGDLAEILSGVIITDYTETTNADESVTSEYSLSFPEEVSFDLIGLDGFELVFGGGADPMVTIGWIGAEDGFTIYILGEFKLRFENNLFIPVVESGGIYSPDPDQETVTLSLSAGIEMDQDLAITFTGGNSFLLTPVMIGDSGVVIEGEIAFDFSEIVALPESLALGLSESWKGAVFRTLSIHLPDSLNIPLLPDELNLDNFHIGNGGITGDITGNWINSFDVNTGTFTGDGIGDLFGFAFALKEIEISFHQNTLTKSSIIGSLIVPFFDEVLDVEIGLTNDGDITVALDSGSGLIILRKPGVTSIEVSSLEFREEDGEFLLTLSGEITPELSDIDWPSFDLKNLTISADGRVKVDGGWIELPQLKTLDFYGFKVEISQLGFGSDADGGADYNWIGFSGGIQIVAGLPLRGGVEGLKVMWNQVTNEPKLKISGVSLAYEIEQVLTFDGVAYFIDEEDPQNANERKRGFKGGMKVGLIPLNGAGFDAQFITGGNEQYKFFYIFIDVEIPIGVPLLPPALGLYGLAGLFAYNMTLDYPALLVDYENDETRPEMTDIDNWIDQEGALAFGAGLTVGTLADNGFVAKAKVVFAIMIPGPVILIEGYTKILSFDGNYPFRVLAVLDVPSGTFLMNIGAEYAFPKNSGDLLDINGSAEAFIPAGDLGGWHLYLGQDKPESKRLQADVLGFFTAQAYFMIDQHGLALGVWIGYALDEKYGVLRVVLESWISGALAVSWMPLQALGTFTWYGRAELSVARIGLGISVEATAGVEVPKPISITGSLTVQLKTPIGKPKATVKIKWEKEGTPPYPLPLAATLGIEHRKAAENWDVHKSSEYGIDEDGLWDGQSGGTISIPENELPLVPPDVKLTLNFDKSVVDEGLIGDNNPEVPPIESTGAYEFKYELLDVRLEYCDTWETSPNILPWESFEGTESDYGMSASWQVLPDPQGMKNTKLLINATSALEISRLLEDNSVWLQQLSLYNPDYPCLDPVALTWVTANFEAYELDQILYPMFIEAGWLFISDFPMRIKSYDAPWLGTTQSLKTEEELELVRCLLILEVPRTAPQNLLLTKGLEIRAATHPQAFVQYREESAPYLDYTRRTELYINRSDRDPASGINPAYIRFPQLLFPSWPDKVWITLMVNVDPDTLIVALDEFDQEVDRIDEFSECKRNPATYLLESSKGNPIRKISFIGHDFEIKEICWNEYEYAETSRVWINLPEEMAELELALSKGSIGTIYFLDDEDNELEAVGFNVADDGTDEAPQPVMLEVGHLAFKLILIEGDFELLQVGGLPQATVDDYADYNERANHIRTTLEENWGKHSAQILLPNKYYRLRIDTASSRRKKGNSQWDTKNFIEYMFFKTGDPPGVYDSSLEPSGSALVPDAESEHYPARGPLQDLSAYIEETIPAGGPPNEPQVLHYRSYDVGVIFNDSYIEQMYLAAGYELGIKLLDNNLRPVLDADGEEIFYNGWGDNPTLSLTREETQYETLWRKDNCLGVSTVSPESNQELMASSPELELQPQTQYKAQVWAGDVYQLYESTFMTSRYASFLHHIHDFQDALWERMALLNDPVSEIDTAVLNAALQNAGGLEEWVQFEQLMNAFDLNPRPLPQKLEITLLNDRNQSYGLLLESPEPLPAERVQDVTLSMRTLSGTIDEFDHILKLIRAAVQPIAPAGQGGTPDYNEQWIELLLLEKTDLSGYRIEYRDNAAGEDELFTLYYTFAADSVYPAGAKLIIYNGVESNAPIAPTEHVLLYAGHSAQSFIPSGTTIRLVDADDMVVHKRPFFQDSDYTTQDAHMIRNQDDARLFFFIKENGLEYSDLQDGIYRIAFTFLRDTGDDKPDLKRFGYTDQEEGQIEFSLPAFLPRV